MAYSPLGHNARKLLGSSALQAVAQRHGATPAQVAIAWGMRTGNVISIPKAADAAHVRENAAAGDDRADSGGSGRDRCGPSCAEPEGPLDLL